MTEYVITEYILFGIACSFDFVFCVILGIGVVLMLLSIGRSERISLAASSQSHTSDFNQYVACIRCFPSVPLVRFLVYILIGRNLETAN